MDNENKVKLEENLANLQDEELDDVVGGADRPLKCPQEYFYSEKTKHCIKNMSRSKRRN